MAKALYASGDANRDEPVLVMQVVMQTVMNQHWWWCADLQPTNTREACSVQCALNLTVKVIRNV
jgi:hypothetical protein